MAKVSLAQQIEEVGRELEQRAKVYPRLIAKGTLRQSIADFHVDRMQAVLRTLQWLQEHEALIKLRTAEPPAPLDRYKQRATMFLDHSRGGYTQVYEITDGDKVIGGKTISAATRNAQATVVYALGDQRFDTADAFVAAYEASEAAAA